jgi:hypothetical protein
MGSLAGLNWLMLLPHSYPLACSLSHTLALILHFQLQNMLHIYRYADQIAAAGTDAGGLSHTEYTLCESGSGAVPMQSFHSLTDPTVPYNGTAVPVEYNICVNFSCGRTARLSHI